MASARPNRTPGPTSQNQFPNSTKQGVGLVATLVGLRVSKRLENQQQTATPARAGPIRHHSSHNSLLHHPAPGSPFLHHHSAHGLAPGSPLLHELAANAAMGPAFGGDGGFSGGSGGGDRAQAYGDEVLQDRRLRPRYRQLKQNWLQQGQGWWSKIRHRGRRGADRWTRRLEDGACVEHEWLRRVNSSGPVMWAYV